jgi:hypothetical protein
MIEGQVMGRTNSSISVEGQPTEAFLAQTSRVYLIRSVSDAILARLSLPKPPEDRRGPPVTRGPQFNKH